MAEEAVQKILVELAGIRKDIQNALDAQADHEKRLRKIEATRPECIATHEKRLDKLEGKSGKRWEALVGQVIGLIAAGAVGWFLGQIK